MTVETKIVKAIDIYQRKYKGLATIQFIRDAVDFFDSRPEAENKGKSTDKLLSEYADVVDVVIDRDRQRQNMNIKELKLKIKDLPDYMPIVICDDLHAHVPIISARCDDAGDNLLGSEQAGTLYLDIGGEIYRYNSD